MAVGDPCLGCGRTMKIPGRYCHRAPCRRASEAETERSGRTYATREHPWRRQPACLSQVQRERERRQP